MKLLIVFIIAICGATYALTDAEITEKWENFKIKFNRSYADEQEEEMRKTIFIDNLQKVEEHNKKFERGEVIYAIGINQFSDKTPEEIEIYTHGILRPSNKY